MGENCAYFSVDVCHEANIKEAINSVIKQFNKININVNCAGIALAEKTLGKDGPHDLKRFKKIIDVNLTGPFLLTQNLFKLFKKKKFDITILDYILSKILIIFILYKFNIPNF